MKVVKHLLCLYEWFALLKSGTCWHIFLSAVTHQYKACLKKTSLSQWLCVSCSYCSKGKAGCSWVWTTVFKSATSEKAVRNLAQQAKIGNKLRELGNYNLHSMTRLQSKQDIWFTLPQHQMSLQFDQMTFICLPIDMSFPSVALKSGLARTANTLSKQAAKITLSKVKYVPFSSVWIHFSLMEWIPVIKQLVVKVIPYCNI